MVGQWFIKIELFIYKARRALDASRREAHHIAVRPPMSWVFMMQGAAPQERHKPVEGGLGGGGGTAKPRLVRS